MKVRKIMINDEAARMAMRTLIEYCGHVRCPECAIFHQCGMVISDLRHPVKGEEDFWNYQRAVMMARSIMDRRD